MIKLRGNLKLLCILCLQLYIVMYFLAAWLEKYVNSSGLANESTLQTLALGTFPRLEIACSYWEGIKTGMEWNRTEWTQLQY